MLFITVFTVFLAINILLDKRFIQKYWQIPYEGSNVLRAVVFAFNAVWVFGFEGSWYVLELFWLQVLAFWLTFDPLLNLARKLPFWHKGEAAGSDALFPDVKLQFIAKFLAICFLIVIMCLTGFPFNVLFNG